MSGSGRRLDPPLATVEAIDLLERGEIRLLGLLPRASNYTFLGEVTDQERTALVVYKPRDGEAPLWDFPEGTLCRREVAAFLVAEWLGWPAVPPTILRDGPQGPGAVQLFVDVDPREHFFTLRDRHLDAFKPVAAFDVVVNNADRKSGHCLDGNGTIWVVDHGVCFGVEPKLRTVIWDFAGQRVPKVLLADLGRLAEAVASQAEIRGRLLELLSPREVEAIARRAERLVASARFPAPGGHRPYPWPPV